MNIDFAKASDLPEVLDFLHQVFCRDNPTHPRFETLYPDLLQPTDEAMSRHAIVRMEGRIVSCVGQYPMLLQVGGCRVPIAGIGQVSTAAEWLGKGFMTALLRAQLERAREEGAALAWLSGRHDRYAHFGFEVAGLSFRYSADAHSAKGLGSDYTIECVPATAEGVTPELFAMREATVDGVIEPWEKYCARFARRAYELWIATAPGEAKPSAWAVVHKDKSASIVEWCGTEEGRLAIFGALAKGPGGVVREESTASRSLNNALRKHCSWMGPCSHHLALLDREKLLDAYRPWFAGAEPRVLEGLAPQEFLRAVFGPEPSAFPHLPFVLPEFDHV